MDETVKLLGYVTLGLLCAVAVTMGAVAVREIPSVARYVRIKNM